MKRLSLALALCASLSSAAAAQVGGLMFPGPGPRVASVAAFAGMVDVVPAPLACLSLRACSSALRGTKAINLCDDLGANCTDIATSASTGILNAGGTHGSNNCDVTGTCRVKIIYDQTAGGNCAGSCDVTDDGGAGNTNRPTFIPNCLGTLPCLNFVASVPQRLAAAGMPAASQPFWISAVTTSTNNGSFQDYFTMG